MVMGEEQALTMMTATITRLMSEYFSPAQRMIDSHNVLFAEALLDDYPHESVGDITVFIKKAAAASYGEEGKKGKIFGQLTFTAIMVWWREYMNEKIERYEKLQTSAKYAKPEKPSDDQLLLGPSKEEQERLRAEANSKIDAVVGAMTKGVKEGGDKEIIDVARRVGVLNRTMKNMDDDRLRLAYKNAQSYPEKRAILQEAHDRGLIQKRIEDHLEKANHNDQTRTSDQGRTAPEDDEL